MEGLDEAKITNTMMEVLVAISDGKEPDSNFQFETLMKLVEAGLLGYENHQYFLTPAGSKVASEHKGKIAQQKDKKNRASRARHATMTGLGLTRTRSGAYEGTEVTPEMLAVMRAVATGKPYSKLLVPGLVTTMRRAGLIDSDSEGNVILTGKAHGILRKMREDVQQEGLWDGPDDSAQVIAAVNKHLDIGNKKILYRPMKPGLWIDFINLPKDLPSAGGGAEAENNRFAVNIRPKGDKYQVEQGVSALGRKWNLRGKTAPLDKIGAYVAKQLNKIAKEVPSKFTHTKMEHRSLRTSIGALRSLMSQ